MVIVEFVSTHKAVHIVKTTHKLHAPCICKLTFKEQLWIFTTLSPKLNFPLVKWLKTGSKLALWLISVECAWGVFSVTRVHPRLLVLRWGTKSGLLLVLRLTGPTSTRTIVDKHVFFVGCLTTLVKRILTIACCSLTWLFGCKTNIGSLSATHYLFSILLKDAGELNSTLRLLGSFLFIKKDTHASY